MSNIRLYEELKNIHMQEPMFDGYIYFSFRYLYNIQFTVGIYRLYITRYLMTVIRFKYRIQVRRSIVMNIITYTTN